MGAFSGFIQGLGQQIRQRNEQNINYQHQANEEQAQQYDKMAASAEANGNDALAADLHKGSFAIRTAMPGQKPKKITNADGTSWDPLDMQGLIARHTKLRMQQQQQQPAQPQPVAPNGITPSASDDPGAAGQSLAPAMTAPPPRGLFEPQPGQQPGAQKPPGTGDPFGGYWNR